MAEEPLEGVPAIVPTRPEAPRKGVRPFPGRLVIAQRHFRRRRPEPLSVTEEEQDGLGLPEALQTTPVRNASKRRALLSTPPSPLKARTGSKRTTKRRAFHRISWRDCKTQFTWREEDKLGEGSFGRVFQGQSIYDRRRTVAVKQISRSTVGDADQLFAEINILNDLDHPHVLRLLEAFEDRRHIYIVTEVCKGGDLEAWLPKLKGQTAVAARICSEIVSVLAHCHDSGIAHRDLKPENVLFLRNAVDSPIRVSDFGLAKRCSDRVRQTRMRWEEAKSAEAMPTGTESWNSFTTAASSPREGAMISEEAKDAHMRRLQRKTTRKKVERPKFRSCVGTPEYMAPEVMVVLQASINQKQRLRGDSIAYCFGCDVWSLGVMAYEMLFGERPYSLVEVSRFVAEGVPLESPYDKAPRERSDSMVDALDFISEALTADVEARPAAAELLRHRWLQESVQKLPATPGAANTLKCQLSTFAGLSTFKRAALLAAVRHLQPYEHEQLRKLFEKVDLSNTGKVTSTALRKALQQAPETPSRGATWLEPVINALDVDMSGDITYSEFLAALMDRHIEDREDLARAAFGAFDLDGDGFVSRAELEMVLESPSAAALLKQGDVDEDGLLNFEEFVTLLRKT
eukprot:TRINITY_DN12069_c0_g1_i1.p1 TRINITY_DN12069_c0_g1~~TRINITY_DN12069_c0_g1_i1.p1  ORF type:complete len:629 (-),score=137.82 TRINITY_DN12069_c0_g1_i1:130-2016(-)